jgi:hypothetical protein
MNDRSRNSFNAIRIHRLETRPKEFSMFSRGSCIAAHRCGAPLFAILPLLVAVSALSGCTSSSLAPAVGPITFTDAFGNSQPALIALTAGQGAYMDVTVTNDNALLGADWSVNCQSALPPGTPLPPGETEDTSCGIFVPLHTMSAPVPSYATNGAGYVTFYTAPASPPKGGTVTLYAASASDPSRYSSVTLTINP